MAALFRRHFGSSCWIFAICVDLQPEIAVVRGVPVGGNLPLHPQHLSLAIHLLYLIICIKYI